MDRKVCKGGWLCKTAEGYIVGDGARHFHIYNCTMLTLIFLFVFICNNQFTGKDSGDGFVTNGPQNPWFLSSGFPLN